MTMPGGGAFRMGEAFVEITTRLDRAGIRRDVEQVGQLAGKAYEGEFSDTANAGIRGRRAMFASAGEALGGAAGEAGGRSFSRGFSDQASKRMRDDRGRFRKVGEEIGEDSGAAAGMRMGARIVGALGQVMGGAGGRLTALGAKMFENAKPQIQGAVGAGILAGGTYGAALIGPMIAGAIAGGVGFGGILGGVKLAARDPAIKVRANEVADVFMSTLMRAAGTFRPALMEVFDIGEDLANDLEEPLTRLFGNSASWLGPLASDIGDAVRYVIDGVADLSDELGPVMDEFGDGLGDLGQEFGELLGVFAEHSDEIARAMGSFFDILDGVMNAYTAIVHTSMELHEFFNGVKDFFSGTDEIGEWNEGTAQAAAVTGDFTTALRDGTEGASDFTKRQIILNSTMAEGIVVAGDYAKMLDMLNGTAQSAEEAELSWQESIDAATEALKENGKTTDANTEKGRTNRGVLMALAKAGQDRSAAIYEQTAATRGDEAAQQAATRAYNQGREALIRAAQGMGMSRKAAIAYADSIYKIPRSWPTTIRLNTSAAYAEMNRLRANLRAIPDEDVNVAIRVTGTSASRSAVRAAIGKNSYSEGGRVEGVGTDTSDDNLALVSRDEFVMRAAASRKLGYGFLNWLNNIDRHGGGMSASAAVATRGPGMATHAAADAGREVGPIIVQVGERTITAMMIDTVTGRPRTVAATAMEGTRQLAWTSRRAGRAAGVAA